METPDDWNADFLLGRVAFRNTDAHGWMHNTQYGDVCEDARMHWLRNRGVSQRDLQGDGLIFALKKSEEEFFTGAKLEDSVAATTNLVKLGNSSMIFEHKIFIENPITHDWILAVTMNLVLVCTDTKNGKSTSLPNDVRAKLLPHISASGLALQTSAPQAKAAARFDIEVQAWL